jgi:hypothetical protein
MIRLSRLFVLIPLALLAACASPLTRVESAPPQVATPCTDCVAAPVNGLAVARPAPCNDYPVTYRAQIPNHLERVRPFDSATATPRSSTGRAGDCSL